MATDISTLRAASKLPANKSSDKTIAEFFEKRKTWLAQVLPKHLTADRLSRIALTEFRRNPKLQECTLESLASAILQCALLGLEPNPVMGHVYLIPFSKKSGNQWITEVQVVTGYKGMVQLVRNSGQISGFNAHPVFERDTFDFEYGTQQRLVHKPVPDGGNLVAAYAVAWTKGEAIPDFEVMFLNEINAIRDASLAKVPEHVRKFSPWVTHYSEMARKCAIRRLFKRLPTSVQMVRANILEDRDYADSGQDQMSAATSLETIFTPESDPVAGSVLLTQHSQDDDQSADKDRNDNPPEQGQT